ncbi:MULTISPECIES: hypothetical protein [Bacillus cereus group]|nr:MULTISPECIES: hypothetical protein [Bacillus cereus group]MDA2662889.1 hypothetical protein [Bacillus cereus group sp. Bc032]MDG0935090.1 hypothetical protein [Bacillus paranthracis]MDK7510898.1 hypothetical protein [Bacillus paranthracis]
MTKRTRSTKNIEEDTFNGNELVQQGSDILNTATNVFLNQK